MCFSLFTSTEMPTTWDFPSPQMIAESVNLTLMSCNSKSMSEILWQHLPYFTPIQSIQGSDEKFKSYLTALVPRCLEPLFKYKYEHSFSNKHLLIAFFCRPFMGKFPWSRNLPLNALIGWYASFWLLEHFGPSSHSPYSLVNSPVLNNWLICWVHHQQAPQQSHVSECDPSLVWTIVLVTNLSDVDVHFSWASLIKRTLAYAWFPPFMSERDLERMGSKSSMIWCGISFWVHMQYNIWSAVSTGQVLVPCIVVLFPSSL